MVTKPLAVDKARVAGRGRPERLFILATFISMLGNNIQLIVTSLLVY
jgi:hypothetical protein